MAWIFDTYSMNIGHSVLGVVTGKPLAVGGSLGRLEATARGGLFALLEALEAPRQAAGGTARRGPGLRQRRQLPRRSSRTRTARKVIALSDSTGGVYNPTASTSPPRSPTRRRHGALAGLKGTEAITNEELLELDCDVLAPCALEQVITADNARQVKARMIVEGANGPTTPAADEILEDRGILVLPDVLANAGGVVVSYFEWVQGLQEYFWKEYEVNAKLNDIVRQAFEETWDCARATADEHADGRLRDRRPARRRGDDDPRPLPLDRRASSSPTRDGLPSLRPGRMTSASGRSSASTRAPFELELVDIAGDPALEAALPRVAARRRDRRHARVHVLRGRRPTLRRRTGSQQRSAHEQLTSATAAPRCHQVAEWPPCHELRTRETSRAERLTVGVAARLSRYLQVLTQAKKMGKDRISSQEIVGVHEHQRHPDPPRPLRFREVRQARRRLQHRVAARPRSARSSGPRVSTTSRSSARAGWARRSPSSPIFAEHGITIAAVFDSDPDKVGRAFGGGAGSRVEARERRPRAQHHRRRDRRPADAAQDAVDALVGAGSRSSSTTRRRCSTPPADVQVHTSNPAVELLYALYFHLT